MTSTLESPQSSGSAVVVAARNAVARHPHSAIEVAMEFFGEVHPAFLHESNDRLVKAGRSLVSLIDLAETKESPEEQPFPLEASIQLLVQEAEMLTSEAVKVPTVRFGKTGLQMPVVTLGCMRFQQAWGPRITTMDGVGSDCQDNLVAILRQAVKYAITHIETARGYGCSELQLGVALQQLFRTNVCERKDLIIQTKIAPTAVAKDFRAMLETSFKNLKVDYIDLFAFHGLNMDHQWEWVFGKDGQEKEVETCMDVIREYRTAGKIRHVGFSTHGSADLIKKFIETDAFEYVNLHYHAFGSYTASGGGPDGRGNLDNAKLLHEKDMGVFIISPFDKGGRLYAPSKKLRRLTLPDAEPMTYMSQWVWNHHRLNDGEAVLPQLHTYTVGAGRPSDLDQPAIAAYLHATRPDDTLRRVRAVTDRLRAEEERMLGKEWVETWWKGLPKNTGSKTFVEHNQIVWIYNSIKAFGMYEFGKARYKSFETNGAKWDWSLTPDENIDKLGRGGWGFVPGLPLDPNADYSEDLAKVPPENIERVIEAIAFVYKWCHEDKKKAAEEERIDLTLRRIRRNFSVSTQLLRLSMTALDEIDSGNEGEEGLESAEVEDQMPKDWETAYDMRPWPDFPDRTLP